MRRVLLVLLALAITRPVTLAQELPPPRNPAGNEPEALPAGPVIVPPQNAPHQAAQNNQQQPQPGAPLGVQAGKMSRAQLLDLFAARRRAQIERKQAQIDRMNQFKAARAAEQQKLYQDWHERYL